MKGSVLKALVLGLLALAQSVWAEVYRGTIGKDNVVMEINRLNGRMSGRFFNDNEHQNRELTVWGKTLTLDEGNSHDLLIVLPEKTGNALSDNELNQRAHMVLLVNTDEANARLQGVWRQPDGRRIPVSLVPVTREELAGGRIAPMTQGLLESSVYDYLLLQDNRAEFLGERDMWGYRVAWWQHHDTEVKTFQLVGGYPAQSMAAINRALQQQWWQTIQYYKVCGKNSDPIVPRLQITQMTASRISYVVKIPALIGKTQQAIEMCKKIYPDKDVPEPILRTEETYSEFTPDLDSVLRWHAFSPLSGKAVNIQQEERERP